jgi:hypothetical protein
MKSIFVVACLVFASYAVAACGDDDGGTSGTGGGAGTGGATGTGGGEAGACKSCKQMVLTAEADLTKACDGTSAQLVGAFVQCTCQDDVCGGAGKGCEAACAGTGTIDADCIACDTVAGGAGGPCETQFNACMADE